MPEVRFDPDGVTVEVDAGTPLARAATRAGLPLELPCGGLGLCGKCRCEVVRGRQEPTPDEQRWLTAVELRDGLRLACRQTVDRDLTVSLSDEVRSRANEILVGGRARETTVDSGVEKVVVAISPAELRDERDDWRRVCETLEREITPALSALRDLPEALAADQGAVTLTLVDGRCVRVDAGADDSHPLGYAVDIGTTTVVCYVLDLVTGAELANAAMLNPQVAYGDDVISRIHHAGAFADGLKTLSREIRQGIDKLVRQACEELEVKPATLCRATIVGNATMNHLFLGINPRGLGVAPFAPIYQSSVTADGTELGLRATPDAVVTVLPNIAGFLGSDTVGAVLAVAPQPDETTLVVDIGTNGEMVLFHDGRWYGCSAAAGPAFEGARIGCGMRGAAGAISRVEVLDGQLEIAVIENEAPRGMCGSGLLDTIASLLELNVLDPTGRLALNSLPEEYLRRLAGEGNQRAFELVDAATSATGEPLKLTGKDVREVQLAKGSIRASIEALMAQAGVTADEVQAIFLAGGFGSFLRVPSALKVGLLPPFDPERIEAVGNAAGAGARLALVSKAEMQRAEELAREVQVLYLAADMVYQMQFVEQMMFPE